MKVFVIVPSLVETRILFKRRVCFRCGRITVSRQNWVRSESGRSHSADSLAHHHGQLPRCARRRAAHKTLGASSRMLVTTQSDPRTIRRVVHRFRVH